MNGLTDYITDAAWEDMLTVTFVLIDDAYQALEQTHGRWRRRGPRPRFHDSEVITVAVFIDSVFHGHEALGLSFLRRYHADLFPALPANGRFNERRRELALIIDQLRGYLVETWGLVEPHDNLRLLDSAPIPVCTYTRAKANATLSGGEYFGWMPSRKAKLFGLRLYLTATTEQVATEWMLAPAGPHDSQMLGALLEDAHGLTLLADGAFNNPTLCAPLMRRDVVVYATPRIDSRRPWPPTFRRLATRLRRRIETAFSVLVTVFNLERPGSRSLSGLVARVATRLLAYDLSFILSTLLSQQAR